MALTPLQCFYLMMFDQNMIIDATRGSIARFVNHACEPNCRMIKWTVAGKPRMALFAGEKGIMAGEELTYDYNFECVSCPPLPPSPALRSLPLTKRLSPFSSKNIQACRCGSAACRGVLGPRPTHPVKEPKDALKPLIPPTGTKRKLQAAVADAAQSLAAKKRRVSVATAAQLTKVRAAVAPEATQRRLVKKLSETSLKAGAKGARAARRVTLAVPEAEGKAERPLSRRESVRGVAADVGKNVVTTIRGRAGRRVLASRKSIRVIEA